MEYFKLIENSFSLFIADMQIYIYLIIIKTLHSPLYRTIVVNTAAVDHRSVYEMC